MISRAWHKVVGDKSEQKDPSIDQSEHKDPSEQKYPMEQSIKQPINQYPVVQSNQPIDPRFNQPTNQSINQPVYQPVDYPQHTSDAVIYENSPMPSAPGEHPPSYQQFHQPIDQQPYQPQSSDLIEAPIKPSFVQSISQSNQFSNQPISQPVSRGAPIAQVAVLKPKPVNKPNIVPAWRPPTEMQPINPLTDSQINQQIQHPHEVVQEYFVPPPNYQPNEQFISQRLDQPDQPIINQSISQPINQPVNQSYAPPAFPVAVPPPGDVAPSVGTRLSAVVDTIRTSRIAGYAHRMLDRHVPPELRAFIMNPSLGALLWSPKLLFQAYGLFSSLKAPFVDVFKGILVGAAMKAVDVEQQSSDHSLKHRLMMRSLRKVATSKDFEEGSLSGDVMRVIVNNLSMNQITQLFTFFHRSAVPAVEETPAIVPSVVS